MDIKKEAYRLYQLDWMQRHGYYSFNDMMRSKPAGLQKTVENCQDTFRNWELDSGFGGELYAGYDEFLSCEYKEQDYMKELFQVCGNFSDLWTAYLSDIEKEDSRQKRYELTVTETVTKNFIVVADSPEEALEFMEATANLDLDMENDLADFSRDIQVSGEAGANAKIDFFA